MYNHLPLTSGAACSMASFDNVCDMNTHAIALIQRGSFQAALDVLRAALGTVITSSTRHQKKQCSPCTTPHDSTVVIQSTPMTVAAGASALFDQDEQHHSFYLFDRALIMAVTSASTARLSITDHNIMLAAMLYNMGLSCHLEGLQNAAGVTGGNTRHDDERSLIKASGIYQMAVSILANIGKDTGPAGLLYLAVLNNMGHLFARNFQQSDVQECLQWIGYILQLHPNEGNDGSDYNLFHRNFITLQGQFSAIGAAAA